MVRNFILRLSQGGEIWEDLPSCLVTHTSTYSLAPAFSLGVSFPSGVLFPVEDLSSLHLRSRRDSKYIRSGALECPYMEADRVHRLRTLPWRFLDINLCIQRLRERCAKGQVIATDMSLRSNDK